MCDIYWFVVVVTTFQDLTKTLGQHNTDFIVSFILCVQGRAQTATFFFFFYSFIFNISHLERTAVVNADMQCATYFMWCRDGVHVSYCC